MSAGPELLPSGLELPDGAPTTKLRFRLSASQLKMFHTEVDGCPRKWTLHYLGKWPRLSSPALQDGIQLHNCIADRLQLSPESFEKKWLAPSGSFSGDMAREKTVQLALALIQHLPARTATTFPPVVEPTYFLDVPEIDTSFYIKPDLHADREWFGDWKSTSATARTSEWCLQAPEFYPDDAARKRAVVRGVHWLKDDIQARLYAHGLMQRWHTTKITARWFYGSKKFVPGTHVPTWTVEHTFERAETRDWFETRILPLAQTMNTIRAAFEAGRLDSLLLVPHNMNACNGTGRFCDVLGPCSMRQSPVPLEKLRLPVLSRKS